MKKIFTLLVFMLLIVSGCKEKPEKISILVPSGTPLVAIGGLLDEKNYDFNIVNDPTILQAGLIASEYDVIIAPVNVGTKLYLGGGSKYKLDSVIVSDNNYIVTKNNVLNSLADLEGKEIVAYGQASTPGVCLRAALARQNVNCSITYKNNVMEAFQSLTNENYVLIAEPQLTKIKIQNDSLSILSVGESLGLEVPQAGIFVKESSKLVNDFLDDAKENIAYLNNNPEEYASKIIDFDRSFSTLGEEVLSSSIPNSNLGYLKAKDNILKMKEFYTLLNTYSPNFLNGGEPNDEFYYQIS